VTNGGAHGVLLTIAYDGRRLSGWARQDNSRTVAGELEGAIRAIDPRASPLRGVSRTDAGVHAHGQLASFDTAKDIDARGWVLALLPHLSEEIAVTRAERVPVGYDPRRHAREKTYRYVILESRVPDPHWHGRAWRVRERLNHDAIAEEALALIGQHDFRAFRTTADTREHTVRTILRAGVRRMIDDPRCWQLEITGDRFLHRMVRIIVGTLVDVGRSRLPRGAVSRALASGTRNDLGMTAPPDGLYLDHIVLDARGTAEWPDHSPDR
jgi:tRNA pseudouridine38-40 synthase